jgi:hypothetical protein
LIINFLRSAEGSSMGRVGNRCLDDKIYFQEASKFMIVVRNSFIAKPGQASKLATQLKEMAAAGKLPNHRVLTDVTGEFNRVVMEYEVESVVGFGDVQEVYLGPSDS